MAMSQVRTFPPTAWPGLASLDQSINVTSFDVSARNVMDYVVDYYTTVCHVVVGSWGHRGSVSDLNNVRDYRMKE